MKPVVVVGSLNLDLVVRPERAPAGGETVFAPALEQLPGGKGGNQAVAAARLGVPTYMLGAVGSDSFGDQVLGSLSAAGVDVSCVGRSATAGTGIAAITVDATGQNRIVVVPGANAELSPAWAEQHAGLIASASALLLQLEIPLETCLRAAQIASAAGVPVLLDPAPARPLPRDLAEVTWAVLPNEHEAEAISGVPVGGGAGAPAAAGALREAGFARVVVKLGARGAYLLDGPEASWHEAFKVPVVDTTAAGDAFAGGLAAALARGLGFRDAMDWAMAAGAMAVTRPGAQSAMGSRAEVEQIFASRRRLS